MVLVHASDDLPFSGVYYVGYLPNYTSIYRADNIQIHSFISCIYAFISINMIINACYHSLK